MPISHISHVLASSHRALITGASWAVDTAEIQFGKRLGAGAYGEVYEGTWRRTKIAIKRLLCAEVGDKATNQFVVEMEILSNLRHDNIVRFLGGCVQPNDLCILFEFCQDSLYDVLTRAEAPLSSARVVSIARQVALGVYYLHCCKPPVLHLDLKSANVLLDDYGRAKVCDFGLSHLKQGSGVRTSRMGSPMWTAPEVLKGDLICEAADTYSFGMLLYELMTCELPYKNVPNSQIVVGVITNMLPRPVIDDSSCEYPLEMLQLMRRCWQHESRVRPNFNAILDVLDPMHAQLDPMHAA